MLINFNEIVEQKVLGMKGRGSIGMHKHMTSDDINYIISGTGKAICDGKEEDLIY